MISAPVYFWKQTPFIRLLLPLIAGIIVQWYCQLPMPLWGISLTFSLIFQNIFSVVSFFRRYQLAWMNGLGIILFIISIGALITELHNTRNDKNWLGHYYSGNEAVIVSLDEPLAEKAKSLKANATVNYIISSSGSVSASGRVIVYFRKDSCVPALGYGSRIIFKKPLQEIRNSGNPGGFDYKRYCLFQGITHQVYLKPGEFEILPTHSKKDLTSFLYSVSGRILSILRSNIGGDKESGLAEALLIGYKDDLDKTLVQSYSNTGVVHIIAISGMHLALIYWLINLLLTPLGKQKRLRWIKPVVAISILWSFSLLTGASASVLRAAVMFTFIVLADSFTRKSNIYNTLAASAFCLLCYDPYWLWDVGFQLSYAAVLSIVIFQRPIYNVFYFKNKLLDHAWKLNAVTFAAQILTTPLSIYHFHQFPVYFFLTNFVAVPLSSIIVLGEILLCTVSFAPAPALFVGRLLTWLIGLMNRYVERIESLPGCLWDGLQINIPQAVLLFVMIAGISSWLMGKLKNGLVVALASLLGFFAFRSVSFINAAKQQKIIVYNVSQHRAVDFISGRDCLFFGDPELLADDFTRNFHLKPSRVLSRVSADEPMDDFFAGNRYAIFNNKRIVLIDTTLFFSAPLQKATVDLLIISKNPRLSIPGLANTFTIRQIVFDGSVPFWKLPAWKRDCDSLHIPYYDASEKGAFVMKLN
jgi:competence protein ComEC